MTQRTSAKWGLHRKLAVLAFLPAAAIVLMAAEARIGHASMNLPDNFGPVHETADSGELMLQAFEGDVRPGPNCVLQSKPTPQTANMSAGELQMHLGHVFTTSEWADFLSVDANTITVLNSEYRVMEGGWTYHHATIHLAGDGVSSETAFIMGPGYAVIGGCYASSSIFPAYQQRFDATMNSLRIVP